MPRRGGRGGELLGMLDFDKASPEAIKVALDDARDSGLLFLMSGDCGCTQSSKARDLTNYQRHESNGHGTA